MKKQLSVLLVLLIILIPIISIAEQSSAVTEDKLSVDTDFDTARAIANYMETHYDITVLIGPECDNASVQEWFTLGSNPRGRSPFLNMLGGHSYTDEIQMIDDAFSVYPPEFFSKFKCIEAPKGLRILLPLQILDTDYNNSVAGVTTIDDGYYNVFLAVGMFVDLNIHHEIWHAMEYRITSDNPHAFDEWSELNPDGFEYLEEHFNQDPWEQAEAQEDWFARGYSKVADYEDRATTIEALFRHDPDWWSTRPHLQKKLDFLIEITEPIFGKIYFYE